MRILVTGSLGYVGSVLVPALHTAGYEVVGLDTRYYRGSMLQNRFINHEFIEKDIRDISHEEIKACGIDSVIHLAALSNDPLGELEPWWTYDINLLGTLHLAKEAKKAGVERFIYSSSQSMYGISNTEEELDEDSSDKKPQTSYAATKWYAERSIKQLASDIFHLVFFRPSTVFGASPALRCDIVFNNLVACAYTTGKIEIKSDGTPWRPVVHVKDVCQAFIAGLKAPLGLVSGRAFNVGIPNGNFTVRDLAKAAQRSVPGSQLVFTGEHGKDTRTYKVSFQRILTELAEWYQPSWDLERGGKELVEFFEHVDFTEEDFKTKCVRFKTLAKLLLDGELDTELRWK